MHSIYTNVSPLFARAAVATIVPPICHYMGWRYSRIFVDESVFRQENVFENQYSPSVEKAVLFRGYKSTGEISSMRSARSLLFLLGMASTTFTPIAFSVVQCILASYWMHRGECDKVAAYICKSKSIKT